MRFPRLLRNTALLTLYGSLACFTLNASEPLPTGKSITPTAAQGSTFQTLNPGLPAPFADFVADHAVTTASSPDGNTLLILTSGYNRNNDSNGAEVASASNEYVFIYDTSLVPAVQRQVIQVPNTFDGIAWNPNGHEFYVTGGVNDNVHIYAFTGGVFNEALPAISLGHPSGVLGLAPPAAAGISVTQDGTKAVVANYENDSISIVSTLTHSKTAELDLRPGKNDPAKAGVAGGEYPFWVVIKGNSTAYVSSIRDREIIVVDISSATPTITGRIPVNGQPNKMILNRAQNTLYVALEATDQVGIIKTASNSVTGYINAIAPSPIAENLKNYKGANPNSLALSPDEKTLYVTDGGTNALAVIDLASRSVAGLVPTGWYPNSVSLNASGKTLFVVNGKSNTGPVPDNCRNNVSIAPGSQDACNATNEYVWQRTKAGFLTLPVPDNGELQKLTEQAAKNNNFHAPTGSQGGGLAASLQGDIKHVIYIVKENRTYDQILGDLEVGNGDPSITVFPEPITPNFHQIARQFVTLDNFYDSGEVSGDGWNWSTSARAADSIEKTEPINYAGRGLGYDYEGTDRNINVGHATVAARQAADPLTPGDVDLLPGTADVSAPDGINGEAGAGYLWDAALRAGLSVRNYGFFIDLTRYSIPPASPAFISPNLRDPFAPNGAPFTPAASGTPVQVAFVTKAALMPITDIYYRGYDNKFADFWRFKEWEREFDQFVQNGNLPNLEFVRFPHDHFGNFTTAIDGVNTPTLQMSDNDYAVGRLVEKIANSPYRDNTVVFVIEDDSQDGPDHIDAHRSNAYIAGAHVKQGAVISDRFTTVSLLRTIEDLLGVKPLGINDALEAPMDSVFQGKGEKWSYSAIVPQPLRSTALPLPAASASNSMFPVFPRVKRDAAYWEQATRGLDFSVEDHLDTARFNLVLWKGIMGDNAPYPASRSGADLRQNRRALLKQFDKTTTQLLRPATAAAD